MACGACHMATIEAGERSLMASGAMLFGGAAYNNGIVPFKNYIFGEAYTRDGKPAKIVSPGNPPGRLTKRQQARGALAELYDAAYFESEFRCGRTSASSFDEQAFRGETGGLLDAFAAARE